MLVLDALIRPAFVLIFHDTADQLVILLQEPLDGLLIDFCLPSQPVRYESLQSNIQTPDPAAKETYYAVGTGWGMAGGSGFPPFCSEMGVVGSISSLGSTMLT